MGGAGVVEVPNALSAFVAVNLAEEFVDMGERVIALDVLKRPMTMRYQVVKVSPPIVGILS